MCEPIYDCLDMDAASEAHFKAGLYNLKQVAGPARMRVVEAALERDTSTLQLEAARQILTGNAGIYFLARCKDGTEVYQVNFAKVGEE